MSPITRYISSMSSTLERIRRVTREDEAPPEDSPPPYDAIDSNPILTRREFRYIADIAASEGAFEAIEAYYVQGSREAIMSSTINAFEVAMETAIREIGILDLAFDSAKWALLIAATTASLAAIRGFGVIMGSTGLVISMNPYHNHLDDAKKEAITVGMDAGRAALSSVYQLDIGPVSHSQMDFVLRRVARKATTTAFQDIFFKGSTLGPTITAMADALGVAIWAGIKSGVPFNHSVAVTITAITAAITVSRLAIKLPPLTSVDTWCQSRQRIVEVENEAIEAGVRAGKVVLPPNSSKPPVHQ